MFAKNCGLKFFTPEEFFEEDDSKGTSPVGASEQKQLTLLVNAKEVGVSRKLSTPRLH